MVRSTWTPSIAGPARRVYRLTPRGMACIDETVPALEHAATVISRYLRTYAAHGNGQARPAALARVQGTERATP
jgi:DNA-binding PadR family transcriptional regulator